MAENILPKGVRFFKKNEKQPDFVIGAAVITINELVTFCKENESLLTEYNGQKQLKLQLLKSKAGELYFSVDTFKPTAQVQTAFPAAALPEDSNDLPF